jgi:hypothetical protein
MDPAQFDAVVLVDAPPAVRRARLRALRGLTNEDADRMIAAQMAAERKRAQSHHVIENTGTLAELEEQARKVFDALRVQAARAGVKNEQPGQRLLLCSVDTKDDAASPALKGDREPLYRCRHADRARHREGPRQNTARRPAALDCGHGGRGRGRARSLGRRRSAASLPSLSSLRGPRSGGGPVGFTAVGTRANRAQ